jgi:site-specific recombinase XerC
VSYVHLDLYDAFIKVMGKGREEREVGLGRGKGYYSAVKSVLDAYEQG